MGKKVLNILILLSMIVIIFFIKIRGVMALTCEWISPLTYINENNLPTNIESVISYEAGTQKNTARTVTVTSFLLKYDGKKSDDFTYGYGIEKGKWEKDEVYLTKKTKKIESLFDPSKGCPKYVYITDTGDSLFVMTDVIEDEYREYLENIQYLNLISKKQNLYGYYSISSRTDKANLSHIKDVDYSFYNIIKKTGKIVFVNKSNEAKYPSTKYIDKFKNELKNEGKTEEETENLLSNLQIDIGNYDKRTYDGNYYDVTKPKWYAYWQKQNIDPELRQDDDRKLFFSRWFNYTGRYIFEDDISFFKNLYIYIYKDSMTRDTETEQGKKKKEIYDTIISTLDNMLQINNIDDKLSSLNDDNCSALCPLEPSSAVESCKNSNESGYKLCKDSHNSCSSNCQNVSGNAYDYCYNACMKEKMGNNTFQQFLDKKNEMSNQLDEQRKENLDQMIENLETLKQVNTPSLDVNFEPYKAKCEDVVIFHTIYMIMVIAAPILTLLFGVIDFTKSVLASDEKKILEFRKKFPKRLLLLMLFILVPLIISFILNLVGGDTSLMNCVINGE